MVRCNGEIESWDLSPDERWDKHDFCGTPRVGQTQRPLEMWDFRAFWLTEGGPGRTQVGEGVGCLAWGVEPGRRFWSHSKASLVLAWVWRGHHPHPHDHAWLPTIPWGGQAPSPNPTQMIGQEPRRDCSNHEPRPTPGTSLPLSFPFVSFCPSFPFR